jgi:hypothetical protein
VSQHSPAPNPSRPPRPGIDLAALRTSVGQAAPPGWVQVTVTRRVGVPHPRSAVWAWLDDPATFVDGQIWPYRVEFVRTDRDRDAAGALLPAFTPGVRNSHHGPLLSLPAIVGEVRPDTHRELIYLYGAYVGSHGLARPSRLVFDLEDAPGATTVVTVTTESLVRRWFAPAWRTGNRVFWDRFGGWATAAIG